MSNRLGSQRGGSAPSTRGSRKKVQKKEEIKDQQKSFTRMDVVPHHHDMPDMFSHYQIPQEQDSMEPRNLEMVFVSDGNLLWPPCL